MQIVIDMPEEVYKASQIIDVKYEDVIQIPLEVIKNGTPLPKGHGKLFDENELKREAIRCEWSRSMYGTLDHTLSYMKPIIEAESEDKK